MEDTNEDSSFLKELRSMDYDLDCWHLWYKSTMDRIIQHQVEFPIKIRRAIQEAEMESRSDAEAFCVSVYESLKSLFLCVPHAGAQWDGLDSDLDTEDQVEVAIRLLPPILGEKLQIWEDVYLTVYYPISLAASSLKTVSFVPQLAKLAIEFETEFHGDEFRGGLWAHTMSPRSRHKLVYATACSTSP